VQEIKKDLSYDPTKLKPISVLRVNCLDCLDRTNIAQFFFSKIFFQSKHPSKKVEKQFEKLMKTLTDLWDENGNILSQQSTGTNSTTRDVSKKEDIGWGDKLMKVCTGVQRFINNNFYDENTNNCLKIITGNHKSENRPLCDDWLASLKAIQPSLQETFLKYNNERPIRIGFLFVNITHTKD